MKIQVQFDCPVGVIVDTETGAIASVHVWDDSVDFAKPTKAYRDEYLRDDHPEFERALDVQREDLRTRLGWDDAKIAEGESLGRRTGVSLFEELPLDDAVVKRAREAITIALEEGPAWPAWEFGP